MSTADFVDIRGEPKVSAWADALVQNDCALGPVTVRDTVRKPSGDLLFALLSAEVTAPEGYPLPHVIFIRGDACIIVPEVVNSDTGERRFVTVVQRRIAWGGDSIEFPAGMLDRDVTMPAAVALKELAEETGLVIDESMLLPLCDRPLFSSPGASDEAIWYYGCRISIADSEWRDLEGRLTGQKDEGEHIEVRLLRKKEILRETRSLQVMLGVRLFEESFGG